MPTCSIRRQVFFCSLGVVLGTALGAAAARAEPVHAVITEPLGGERLSEMAPQFKAWSSQSAPQFGDKLIVRRATLVRQEGQPSKTPASAVHVASFYSTHVSVSDYKRYTERYIAPNMNLQRAAGIMSRYAMYVEQEPVAGQTRSLLVTEYTDAAAYAHREPIKEVGRQKLLADPEWKRIHDVKETIRSDISSTAAIDVGAAMPDAH